MVARVVVSVVVSELVRTRESGGRESERRGIGSVRLRLGGRDLSRWLWMRTRHAARSSTLMSVR